jgi:hypothetical protein
MPPDRRGSGTPTWLSIKNSRCNASALSLRLVIVEGIKMPATNQEASVQRMRMILWVTVACGVAALTLTAIDRVVSGPVRWTSWVIPLLVMATPVALLLPTKYARTARVVMSVAIPVAFAVIAFEIAVLLRR